jgi:dienelactone hydrolase
MIDPDRIALGGFSAGATIAINSAFAENAPVAAVVALSGRMSIQSAGEYVHGPQQPPLMMVFGENDLVGTFEDMEPRSRHFVEVGLEHEVVHIAGATHFYPLTSQVVLDDGSRSELENLMANFLYRCMRLEVLSKSVGFFKQRLLIPAGDSLAAENAPGCFG